jgi:hypothetical protein
VDGNTVTAAGKEKDRTPAIERTEKVDLGQYIQGVKDHDWKKSSKLKLQPSASLAKDGETYVYTLDEGSDTAKRYVIRFRRNPAAALDADVTKAENILSNPGAEKGEEHPDDWEQGAQVDGVEYVWDKEVAFEGKASLCIAKTTNRYFPIAHVQGGPGCRLPGQGR